MNLVIDVSVFIDRLFIYDEERSLRARTLFRLVDDRGLNIFEPPGIWHRACFAARSKKALKPGRRIV